MSKVTIIIPTYNSGQTVRIALESVRQQTFTDWECLVIDGASKDNTLDIVKEYCKSDGRFRYICEKDNGIYDAFNKGWKNAKSEWIHYLGSDDILMTDGMSRMASELDTHYAVVTGDVILCRVDGSKRLRRSEGIKGCHQGVLMQRTVIERMGGFDERYRIIADYDLLIRTYKAGYKVKNVRVPLAYFRIGGVSQKLSSQWEVMKEIYKINKTNEIGSMPLFKAFINFITSSLVHLYRVILSWFKKKEQTV